jgi:hypothetical protein
MSRCAPAKSSAPDQELTIVQAVPRFGIKLFATIVDGQEFKMEAKRPLGLLTIRKPDTGEIETFTIFTHFQNGVDYLKVIGENWEKLRENEYKTQTGYIVRLEMVVPKFIDLRSEEYLWMNPVKDLKDVKTNV